MYRKDIIPKMMKEFGYKNPHQVPRVEKIVINMGIGEGSRNADIVDQHAKELAEIAGQKPVVTRARKSEAAFKIRKGMPIGLKVTLRGDRMYEFLYKLINLALPRVRDFHGVSQNSFDGRGNYALGIGEQLIFPEIDYDEIKRIQGMDIIIVTTSKTNREARKLLEFFGMPFSKS
ncbi:MAG: 50S ribosomal protein L5 [Thermotoga sp.]|nr:50S ribosomal protein L5 [Thermotogota bacterium]RKX54904.1 MAG: 50S ribosomal protein L5 [Thermotoga sp.]